MNQGYKSHYITSATFLSFLFFSNKHKFSIRLFSLYTLIHLIQTISLSSHFPSFIFFHCLTYHHTIQTKAGVHDNMAVIYKHSIELRWILMVQHRAAHQVVIALHQAIVML